MQPFQPFIHAQQLRMQVYLHIFICMATELNKIWFVSQTFLNDLCEVPDFHDDMEVCSSNCILQCPLSENTLAMSRDIY